MFTKKILFSVLVLFFFSSYFSQNCRNEYFRTCENFQHPLLSKVRFQIKKDQDTVHGRCFRFTYVTDSKNVEYLASITHLFLGKEQPILNNDEIIGLDFEKLSLPKVSRVTFKYNEKYILETISFFDQTGKETPNVWGVSQYKYEPYQDSKNSDLFVQKRFFEGKEKFEKLAYIYRLRHSLIDLNPNRKMRVWKEIKRMNYNIYREYIYDLKNKQLKEIEYSENGYFKKVTLLDRDYMYEKESAMYITNSKDSISFFKIGNYHKKTSEITIDQNGISKITTRYWADASKTIPQAYGSDGYQEMIEEFKNGFIIESIKYNNLNKDLNQLKINSVSYVYDDEKSNTFSYTKSYRKKDGESISIFSSDFPNKSEKFEYDNQGFLILHRIAKPEDESFYGDNLEIIYQPDQNYSSYKIDYKMRDNKDFQQIINLGSEGLLTRLSFKKANGKDTTDYHNLMSYLGRYDLFEFDNFKALEINYKPNREVSRIAITKENDYKSTFDFTYLNDGKSVEITKDRDLINSKKTFYYNYDLFNNKYLIKSLYYEEEIGAKKELKWKEEYEYKDNIVILTRTDENRKIIIDKYTSFKSTSFIKENSRFEKIGNLEMPILYDKWWLSPHRMLYTYDKNLNITVTKYYNDKNELISQFYNDDVFYDSVVYNSKNLLAEKYFLNQKNEIINDHDLIDNYCTLKFDYNDRNQIISEAFYVNNEPYMIDNVWKSCKEVDAYGRKIKEYKLEKSNEEIKMDSDHYSSVVYKYSNDNENYRKITSKSYFLNNRPVLNSEGYHEIKYEYDKFGLNSGYKYFGLQDLKPVPILKKGANYHYEKINSTDSLICRSFYKYDSDRSKDDIATTEFASSDLHMYKTWPHPENNNLNIREEFYGVNKELINFKNPINDLTYAIGEYEFNEDGDTTRVRRFLKDKSLLDGYYTEIIYNSDKLADSKIEKMIEYHFKISPDKYAKRNVQIREYIYYENKIELRNLNEKRKPVSDEKGVASYTLDRYGNIIERFDINDRKIN